MVRRCKPSVPINVPKTPMILGTLKEHMSVRKPRTRGMSSNPKSALPKKPAPEKTTPKVPSSAGKADLVQNLPTSRADVPTDRSLLAERRKQQEWQKKELARQNRAVERRAKKIANGFLYKGRWIKPVVKEPLILKIEDESTGSQECPVVIEDEEVTSRKSGSSPMVVIPMKSREYRKQFRDLEEHEDEVPTLAHAATTAAVVTAPTFPGPRPCPESTTVQLPSATLTFFGDTKGATHSTIRDQRLGLDISTPDVNTQASSFNVRIPSATLIFFGDKNRSTHHTMRNGNFGPDITTSFDRQYPRIAEMFETHMLDAQDDAGSLCDFVVDDNEELEWI